MTDNMEKRTVRWKFLGSLEPPRVVHCRCEETKQITDTIFAQVTVRMHTQQVEYYVLLYLP
jgi:large subunit ribosomal protein L45